MFVRRRRFAPPTPRSSALLASEKTDTPAFARFYDNLLVAPARPPVVIVVAIPAGILRGAERVVICSLALYVMRIRVARR